MNRKIPRIIGTGWKVPDKIRLNDDPIFEWLREHVPNANQLFSGYDKRHVLSEGEELIDIMLPAAQMALSSAGRSPEDIDILIGRGSVSAYYQPNMLLQLHQKLGLSERVWVIPVGDDYSNYGSSIMLADSMVRAGHAENVLICLGGNWTRNVDYHTPQSISAADGAGAAVVAMSNDPSHWHMVDQCTVTDSSYYGSMFTNGEALTADPPLKGKYRSYSTVYSPHFFQITEKGKVGFKAFGEVEALTSVTRLLERNCLTPADISFMPHQTSAVLIDYWVDHLHPAPGQVLSKLKEFANTTVAAHALNFAWFDEHGPIEKDFIVMLALGPGMHANAMMVRRND